MSRVALYTADPWDSALVEIRVRRPAAQAGVEVLQGYRAGEIDHSLVDQVDAIILQRDFPRFSGSPQLVQRARNSGKPILYETDDWLFDVPDWNVQQTAYKNYLNGMLWTILQADRVITCNTFLADKLAAFNPNVYIFENYLVDEWWPMRPPLQPTGGPLKIGFMGSPTHVEDLHGLTPVLQALLEKYPAEINLVFWGCPPPQELRERSQVQWHAIQFQGYAEFAAYFSQQVCDIFIAPLNIDEFNRAKSPLKYFEYTSLGVPGVYSQIDPYEHVIVDGENGLLASTPAEWSAKIEQLVRSPELRSSLAREAQARVTRDWLLHDHYPRWQEAISGPWGQRGPAGSAISLIAEKTQQQIWEMEAAIGALSQEVVDQRNQVSDLNHHLESVLQSNTWKLALRLQKWIDLVRPRK